jgi:NAD(P)-dependent dehydrogenase (short-subunit alcohol dehydrogenase family)
MADGTRTLLIGDGPLADGLHDGLVDRGHVVAQVVPVRADGWSGTGTGIESGAGTDISTGIGTGVGLIGRPDLVVHVPPIPASPVPLVDQSTQQWVEACEMPMAEAFAVARASRPHLSDRARLVWVVPTAAMGGAAGFVGSAAASEGIRALAKSTARQWGSDGLTTAVLAVAPELAYPPEAAAGISASTSLAGPALGRPGDAYGDVSPLLDLLADPAARFVTGATLVVDGGVWMAP